MIHTSGEGSDKRKHSARDVQRARDAEDAQEPTRGHMTEGEWEASQEASVPGLTGMWVTLGIALMPTFAWLILNAVKPRELAEICGGFAICAGAFVVGGLVLYYALSPSVSGDSKAERNAQRRMRKLYEQTSNNMVFGGLTGVAFCLIGVWVSARSLPDSELVSAAGSITAGQAPADNANPAAIKLEPDVQPKKSQEEAKKDFESKKDANPTPPVPPAPTPNRSETPPPAAPTTNDGAEDDPNVEWYIPVIEHLKASRRSQSNDSPFPGLSFRQEAMPPDNQLLAVVVLGRFRDSQRRLIAERLSRVRDRSTGTSGHGFIGTGRFKGYVAVIWSVPRINDYADAVDFGTVDKVDRERRVVVVAPDREITELQNHVKRTYLYRKNLRAPRGNEIGNALRSLQTRSSNRFRNDYRDALRKLGEIEPTEADQPRIARALESLLTDKDIFTVNDAAKALAVWGDEKSLPKLIAAIDHPSRWTIHEAVDAIGDFDSPKAAEFLADTLKDQRLHGHASRALKRMGELAEKPVLALLEESIDDDLARHVCEVLKEVGGKETVTKLKALRPSSKRFDRFYREVLEECEGRE